MAEGALTLDLKILSPSSEIEGGIRLQDLPASTTVRELRLKIQHVAPSNPGPERMRLIYRGRLVANDADTLENVFGAANIRESKDQSLHLPLNPLGPADAMPLPEIQQRITQLLGQDGAPPATPAPETPGQNTMPAPAQGVAAPLPGQLPPRLANVASPNGRAIRQEGVGPNGSRWTVTYNNFTANMPLRPGQPTLPRPVPHPAAFAVPPRPFGSPAPGGVNVPLSWLLPRLRRTLQEAAQEVDNVRTLLDPTTQNAPSDAQPASSSTSFPGWRIERIREHLRTITHNLNMVESGLSDPTMQLNMDVIGLRQAAGEVRRQANEFSRALDAHEARIASELAQSTAGTPAAAASDPLIAMASAATRTLPSDAPQELFLLSSPQGPVGVLFDQRGTYTTTPFVSTLPSEAFVDQFNQNRQLIAGLGQQIAQSSHNLHNQLGSLQPTPTQQPAQAQPPNEFDQNVAQRVIQDIIQNQNERQAQNQPAPNANAVAPAENDRVGNIAGHLWLIFKLACFVYIFAGGGGWYRPLLLGSIAGIVYLVQLGIFEAQLNLVRRHFEALLPNADRIVQGRNAPQQPADAQGPANGRVTPEEAARRLLQQQRNNQLGWVRESMRTVERGVAIFVASLWPGIGERMVHAQEERERLERVAASEERERLEEERRQAEEAANAQNEEKNDDVAASQSEEKREETDTLGENFMETGVSEKGKETVEDEAENTIDSSIKGKEKAAYVEDATSPSTS
ncbi:hypothetical protein N0V94_005670 [Neodidymelliopsis sp. IMI 364377]|nr:hypothetical protein N0V94_005670 [Neodidymelliopsis sp. IMI 364377]